MKIVREFTYPGDECEAGVTARTRCWWVKLRECVKLSQPLSSQQYCMKVVKIAPERKRDEYFTKDGDIHGESDVWSTAQR